jgi:hypothetical protein
MEAWELLRSGLVQDGTVNDVRRSLFTSYSITIRFPQILYGLPIGITKLAEASELARELGVHGATLRVLVDHLEQARALQTFSESSNSINKWSVFVKVDCGYKSVYQFLSNGVKLLLLLLFNSTSA